eukprot:CAMPEP_0117428530 /NCGR_PEP_ID=MMETSP0758-20121206/8211_1 /TAXON_ID=63605 /ORGANISM="Percolomonas cosmopolitus, Strain AE-1 (ATCC 50343)" /LENGTH=122 /DNA_ID=CAMNT_0005214925 /DNA_START=229 /DNA_END=593 /DNA_ORIENTATION=-
MSSTRTFSLLFDRAVAKLPKGVNPDSETDDSMFSDAKSPKTLTLQLSMTSADLEGVGIGEPSTTLSIDPDFAFFKFESNTQLRLTFQYSNERVQSIASAVLVSVNAKGKVESMETTSKPTLA